jgi:uncharacterized membrane protein
MCSMASPRSIALCAPRLSVIAYSEFRDWVRATGELHRACLGPFAYVGMQMQKPMPDEQLTPDHQPATERLPASTKENLELLTRFKDGEEAKISGLQNAIEQISRFFGSPLYFAFAVVFIVLWIAVNSYGVHAHWHHVDAPPFSWLQGLVSSNALLLTVAVLIRQNRMAHVAEHRAHLDLQINLLTEQKVTKILQIIDELRPDLQVQGAGTDAEVTEMSKPADAHTLMHAIKEKQEDR